MTPLTRSNDRIEQMELETTDLVLRRRTDLGFTRDRHIKCASSARGFACRAFRRMAAGTISLGAVLRDARLRTRLIDAGDMIRSSKTQYWLKPKREAADNAVGKKKL
jgi:hypothetical protein